MDHQDHSAYLPLVSVLVQGGQIRRLGTAQHGDEMMRARHCYQARGHRLLLKPGIRGYLCGRDTGQASPAALLPHSLLALLSGRAF